MRVSVAPPDDSSDPILSALDPAHGEQPSLAPSSGGGLLDCLAELGVAVIESDAEGQVTKINEAAERLTGWPASEARLTTLDAVFRVSPVGPKTKGDESEHTARLFRRDGVELPIQHALGAGTSGGRVVTFRDTSASEHARLHLARLAEVDGVTGLLNRHAITARIEEALAESRRMPARHALCLFDLDRFRLINSTCGHEAGDDLLQWVATRVHELIGPGDSAGRIGGDEFAVLLHGREGREAERVARDLQRRLLEFRFGWGDKTFTVGASFGLVSFGTEFQRAADVLGAADHACRMAKDHGRGRLQVYLDADGAMTQSRLSIQWVASLRRHLEEGRLRLFAQNIHPLLGSNSDEGAHFEVLTRLVGDDGTLKSPVGIIQAAENSGLMDGIDRFVVRQAFRMIGGLPPAQLKRLDTCSINLSAISLLREGLLDYIVTELQRASVPPDKICFEITETAALANLSEVLWLMQVLGALGCRFAIDDFGSGHASYAYIENLPVDYVKIDGAFVRDLPTNPLHRAIVESVHRIGTTLGMKTVAESVENGPVAELLTSMGVHYGQGWHFGKPKPMGEILSAIRPL